MRKQTRLAASAASGRVRGRPTVLTFLCIAAASIVISACGSSHLALAGAAEVEAAAR
jgi:hypothetical protein